MFSGGVFVVRAGDGGSATGGLGWWQVPQVYELGYPWGWCWSLLPLCDIFGNRGTKEFVSFFDDLIKKLCKST
ncbi:hypothetical protein V6N11_033945 [Hibiscus sabdariffa]|uniref:Uncharacterized protein n=1 Tax=Hibiscus sabdariffa TaxID=183260 RepID=A0ABR2S0W5_9ROSI